MNVFTVSFFGHRTVDNPFQIEELLQQQIRRLLTENEYTEFLVGRNGEFDQHAAAAVRKVKRAHRDDNSALVLVLPYTTAEYLNNIDAFKKYYDSIEISYAAEKAHPKAAIQIRNREMVDRTDLILCFVETKQGGAYQTMEYARKQNKNIINIAEIGISV